MMKRQLLTLLSLLLSVAAFSAPQKPSDGLAADCIVVDHRGTGDFLTVGEAIESLRGKDPATTVTVFIRNGLYKEKLVLPLDVNNVRFVGESRDGAVLSYDDYAAKNNLGTTGSYSFRVQGSDITFENLTVENTAGPLSGQAVALYTEGDRIVVRNCRILGNQDTLFIGNGAPGAAGAPQAHSRVYFENCHIEGTTDYIFGPATAWFERCSLLCKKRSHITAASTPQDQAWGFVFNRCRITTADGISDVSLGRPWRPYGTVLYMNCTIPEGITPAGWNNWGKPENEQTARYSEYNNNGPGADLSRRVSWAKVLTREEAEKITVPEVMKGRDGWNPLLADRSSLEWSIRMAESVMIRHDSLVKSTNSPNKWQYDIAWLAGAIGQLSERTGDERYFQYLKTYMDYYVAPDGTARYYRLEEYNLDRIRPAVNLFALWHQTGDDRYKTTLQNHILQLKTHPRTSDGGYWHKQIYPWQMWLDGLFMASPFMAQYGAEFNEPAWFDEVVHQITTVYRHTLDPRTGLLYHGWDESRKQGWSNPETGQSPNFWSRAMGWYTMAMVDVLDFLPADHPGRPEVVAILNRVCEALLKVRDPESCLWYQVTDAGDREGNYLEASGSGMFAYTFAKGAIKGYLPPEYLDQARRTYRGTLARLINVDDKRLVNLEQTCGGAGLGGERDGSFEYYISERIVQNDTKGVAAFILTGLLLDQAESFRGTDSSATE
jgi:unsaturated rhamnogalacturonyl hydrolase